MTHYYNACCHNFAMVTNADNSRLNGPPTGCLVSIFTVRINSKSLVWAVRSCAKFFRNFPCFSRVARIQPLLLGYNSHRINFLLILGYDPVASSSLKIRYTISKELRRCRFECRRCVNIILCECSLLIGCSQQTSTVLRIQTLGTSFASSPW